VIEPSDAQALQAFIDAAIRSGAVWGLEHPEGWALAASVEYEDSYVMPFWSTEAEARQCAAEEWAEYNVSGIPLEDFINTWLPGMQEDGYLVGTDWDVETAGPEIEPDDLAEALEAALDELQ
jgi:hypothetical protein